MFGRHLIRSRLSNVYSIRAPSSLPEVSRVVWNEQVQDRREIPDHVEISRAVTEIRDPGGVAPGESIGHGLKSRLPYHNSIDQGFLHHSSGCSAIARSPAAAGRSRPPRALVRGRVRSSAAMTHNELRRVRRCVSATVIVNGAVGAAGWYRVIHIPVLECSVGRLVTRVPLL